MFAVIRTGGKQYRVAPGDRLMVERLAAEPGEKVRFDDVLMLAGESLTIGAPMVDGAAVQAEVVDQVRGPKVLNFKRRRRKASSKRLKGHRQYLTLVEVTEILERGGDGDARPALGARAARRAGGQTAGGATATMAAHEPGNLLSAAEGEPDDLTRLPGVGPKLQEKLNANGVFHFRQIAEWSPEEVARMDEQLKFKGRIAREDWVGQARTFLAEEK